MGRLLIQIICVNYIFLAILLQFIIFWQIETMTTTKCYNFQKKTTHTVKKESLNEWEDSLFTVLQKYLITKNSVTEQVHL